MSRTEPPEDDVEALNKRMKRPENTRQKRLNAAFEAATAPVSGAAGQHAAAGAILSVEERPEDASETADAIKRAAESDTRV